MKKMIILGAGQMGIAILSLFNKRNYEVVAYGDNKKSGLEVDGIPVLTIEEALKTNHELALVAIADKIRGDEIINQVYALGYQHMLIGLWDFIEALDFRSATLIRLALRMDENNIKGEIAELGVYKGDFAVILNRLFSNRRLYLFDTFEGFDHRDVFCEGENGYSQAQDSDFSQTSEELVMSRLIYPERVIIRKGYFPDTAWEIDEKFALVSLDADLFLPTLSGLEYFVPRMTEGGAIILHDYQNLRFAGVKSAVHEFEKNHQHLHLVPLCDLHGTAVIAF